MLELPRKLHQAQSKFWYLGNLGLRSVAAPRRSLGGGLEFRKTAFFLVKQLLGPLGRRYF